MEGARMQQYAIGLEHDLCYEYNCQRFGIGGIANSDSLRRSGFYYGMALVLVKYYYSDNIKVIDDFLEEYHYIEGQRLDDIELKEVENINKKYEELYKSLRNK